MTRRHATWTIHVARPSYSALVLEIGDFSLKRHTLLRTLADVATRPWRTPHSRAAGPRPSCTREYGKDQKSDRDASTSCRLESLDLVAQRVYCLALKEIAFTPFRIVERIAIEEHHKTLHLDVAHLLGQNGKALGFQFAICHSHVSHLQKTPVDWQCTCSSAPFLF